MSFLEQQANLREFVIDSYNRQRGTNLVPGEWSVLYDRLDEGTVLSMTFIAPSIKDSTRIRFVVTELGPVNNIRPFELKLKKNYNPGTLDDETFVALGTVKKSDFPDVFNYLNSEEFKKFNSTPQRLAMQNGSALKLMSGLPLETQR